MSVTDKKGVDVIYDAVGGPILNTVIKWQVNLNFIRTNTFL